MEFNKQTGGSFLNNTNLIFNANEKLIYTASFLSDSSGLNSFIHSYDNHNLSIVETSETRIIHTNKKDLTIDEMLMMKNEKIKLRTLALANTSTTSNTRISKFKNMDQNKNCHINDMDARGVIKNKKNLMRSEICFTRPKSKFEEEKRNYNILSNIFLHKNQIRKKITNKTEISQGSNSENSFNSNCDIEIKNSRNKGLNDTIKQDEEDFVNEEHINENTNINKVKDFQGKYLVKMKTLNNFSQPHSKNSKNSFKQYMTYNPGKKKQVTQIISLAKYNVEKNKSEFI